MTPKTVLLTVPLVLIAAVGCKKTEDPPIASSYQAGVPGGAGAAATAMPTAPAAPVAAPAPTAPTPVPPVPADPTISAAVTPLLTQLATTQTVAGSKPVGTALVGNVAPGTPLETSIMLQPNKCYSVVAVGMPPIAELNVQLLLVTVLPGMAPVLAIDQDAGASAVLGKKPNCYKWAVGLPASAKVSVQSAAGAGVAAAQIYEK